MSFFQKKDKKKGEASSADAIREERKYLIWRNNDFFLREAYKTARTNVMFSIADVEGCRVIAVTSSLQSEGKSITAANLAMTFADMGSRTLIIDCDLRKPKMSRLLDVGTNDGLTDVLIGKTDINDAVVRIREKKPLWLLSSGKIPPNPSELLSSESMRTLLEGCKKSFDYIVLDTPPVDVVSDAMVLAPVADGYLFVVRAGKSDRRAVMHSIYQLEYANAKILGVIFNGTGQGGGYGYKRVGYGRYGRYSRYGGRYGGSYAGYGGYGYGRYGYGRYGYGRGYGYGGYGNAAYGYGTNNQQPYAETPPPPPEQPKQGDQ